MSPKNEFEDQHHKPRDHKHKKRNRKGLGEDVQDRRAQRLNFKKYLRELQEEDLEDFDPDDQGA